MKISNEQSKIQYINFTVDNIIEDKKNRMISDIVSIAQEDSEISEEVILEMKNIIYSDLEEKRIKIKEYFLQQIDEIDAESTKEALSFFKEDLNLIQSI